MQLHFKSTNYELTLAIREFAEKKLSAISKFLGTEDRSEAQVYVELGKVTGAHVHGRIWRAEINFDQGGKQLRAEATEESLEDAIDRAIEDLSHGLRSHKTRSETLSKRGGRMLKSMLRGFKT